MRTATRGGGPDDEGVMSSACFVIHTSDGGQGVARGDIHIWMSSYYREGCKSVQKLLYILRVV